MQAHHRPENGSITIYMTLTLAVLLSLFTALIESARERALWVMAYTGVDMAVYSVFAEYNRQLFEEYDLLLVDTSYGTGEKGRRALENRLSFYIDENLSSGNTADMITSDLTSSFLADLTIEDLSLATDENGLIFQRQAVEFMKQKYGVGYVEAMQKEFSKAEKNELFTKNIAPERESNESILDDAKENGVETGEVDEDGNPIVEKAEFENPADTVNAARSLGILSLVAKEGSISNKAANEKTLLSKRGIDKKGSGLSGRDGAGGLKKLWFEMYIREHCGNYLYPKDDGVLSYQMEYIISGHNNDIDNLKSVVTRLLLLRETANVAHLFSDPGKTAQAEALALSIATAAGLPVITEPLKISLMFAWAYAESVWDVRSLLAGKKIPLIKTAADWHFSLEGMLGFASEEVEADASLPDKGTSGLTENLQAISEGKLGYEEYLILFLTFEAEGKVTERMMDIAEADVRAHSGDYGFCLDDCMDHLKIEATVAGRRGGSCAVTRDFSYT